MVGRFGGDPLRALIDDVALDGSECQACRTGGSGFVWRGACALFANTWLTASQRGSWCAAKNL